VATALRPDNPAQAASFETGASNAQADAARQTPTSTVRALAVVVCHEPQRADLAALVGALLPSTNFGVVLVDNSESEVGRVTVAAVGRHCGLEIFCNERNLGVAEAQNIGIRRARQLNYTHVLLLDQDSALDGLSADRMLSAFWVLRLSGRRVAALGPSVVDPRTKAAVDFVRLGRLRMKRLPRTSEPVSCDMLISSGCLIALDAIDEAGMMDSELFIDYVDMEWCARARAAGYEVFGLPDVTMNHTIGEASVRVAGRSLAVHTPVRSYYLVRNALLFARKPHLSLRWRLHLIYRAVGHLVLFSLFFPKRLERIRWMALGVWDGLAGRAGRLGGSGGLGRSRRDSTAADLGAARRWRLRRRS
jgi:rhamnosyltransferase